MKKLSLIYLFFIIFNAYAQNYNYILNDSIKWELRYRSIQLIDSNKISPSHYQIRINNPINNYIEYSNFDSITVDMLLNDSLYDWATNLILYSIYKRNANMFFAFKILNRDIWVDYFKEKDIQYWRSFFSKSDRPRILN
jgi:hypothetical protein